MKQMFFFNPTDNLDIHNPNNYSLVPIEPSEENHHYKLHAILANDSGNNKPIIDELELNVDFIRSVQGSRNIGIVMLNKRFIKRKNWFDKFIDKVITYI